MFYVTLFKASTGNQKSVVFIKEKQLFHCLFIMTILRSITLSGPTKVSKKLVEYILSYRVFLQNSNHCWKFFFSLHMHAKPSFAQRLQTAKMASSRTSAQNNRPRAQKKWPLGVK